MKKIGFLLVLMLSISSCSFVIGSDVSTPSSTHIPNLDTGRKVFFTLQGTIWKLENNSAEKDSYLYIDEYEDKYAIKSEKKGVKPEKYPAYYEYTELGREQTPIPDPLKFYNTVIFEEEDDNNKFIGFYLVNNLLLYSAESTGSSIAVIESLESKTGDMWRLYIY